MKALLMIEKIFGTLFAIVFFSAAIPVLAGMEYPVIFLGYEVPVYIPGRIAGAFLVLGALAMAIRKNLAKEESEIDSEEGGNSK